MHIADINKALLVADHISLQSNGQTVLHDLDIAVSEKSCLCISGDGRSGESLLLRTLAGLSSACISGTLTYRQSPLTAENAPPIVRWSPGMLMSRTFDALLENIRLSQQRSRQEWAVWLGDRLVRWGFPELRQLWDLPVLNLSSLHQRMIAIAREALAQPQLLLIDDLTRGLDEYDRFVLLDFIRTLSAEMSVVIVVENSKDADVLGGRHVALQGGIMVYSSSADSEWSRFDPLISDEPACASEAQATQTQGVFLPTDHIADEQAYLSGRKPLNAQTNEEAWISILDDLDAQDLHSMPSELSGQAVSASCGPRGFYWVIEGVLAGCPLPGLFNRVRHDLDALKHCKVNALVSLSTSPLDADEVKASGLENPWLGNDPTLAQLRMLATGIERALAKGQVVAVHCTSGNRRTGLVICAYLIHAGQSVPAAIEQVRAANPAFVVPEQYMSLLRELAVAEHQEAA